MGLDMGLVRGRWFACRGLVCQSELGVRVSIVFAWCCPGLGVEGVSWSGLLRKFIFFNIDLYY